MIHNDHGLIKNDIKSICIHSLRILRWKEGYQSIAFITLLVWTFLCFHTQLVMYTLPIWMTLACMYPIQWTEAASTDLLKEELSLVLPSLDYVKDVCQQWHHRTWTTWTRYGKTASFVLFFSLWMLSFHTLGTRSLVWTVGAVCLAWHSRGFQVIRLAYHRVVLIVIHAKQKLKSVSIPHEQPQQEELDRCYRFNVTEHQRWWLHKGWISVLLPHDRPKWSDEYLKKVPSIYEFQLPPAITKFSPTTQKSTEITWEWVTTEWQYQEHETDKHGWEYGSWDWTNWSAVSAGPRKLTRRRHWFRHARLVIKEQQQKLEPIEIPPRSRSVETSCSLSTSASSFEEEEDCLCTTPTFQSTLSPKTATLEHHFWLSR